MVTLTVSSCSTNLIDEVAPVAVLGLTYRGGTAEHDYSSMPIHTATFPQDLFFSGGGGLELLMGGSYYQKKLNQWKVHLDLLDLATK